MSESKLRNLSIDFSVQIINLVKGIKSCRKDRIFVLQFISFAIRETAFQSLPRMVSMM